VPIPQECASVAAIRKLTLWTAILLLLRVTVQTGPSLLRTIAQQAELSLELSLYWVSAFSLLTPWTPFGRTEPCPRERWRINGGEGPSRCFRNEVFRAKIIGTTRFSEKVPIIT
jgi:hypothetical protein